VIGERIFVKGKSREVFEGRVLEGRGERTSDRKWEERNFCKEGLGKVFGESLEERARSEFVYGGRGEDNFGKGERREGKPRKGDIERRSQGKCSEEGEGSLGLHMEGRLLKGRVERTSDRKWEEGIFVKRG
jgi:hypothetical protein